MEILLLYYEKTNNDIGDSYLPIGNWDVLLREREPRNRDLSYHFIHHKIVGKSPYLEGVKTLYRNTLCLLYDLSYSFFCTLYY